MNIKTGEVLETPFNEPTDSVSATFNDHSICGPYTYQVLVASNDSAQTLVTLHALIGQPTTHKLVATTNNELEEGTYNLKIVISLGDPSYPTQTVLFTLSITPPACDCSLLTWQAPDPQTLTTTVLKAQSDSLTINHHTVVHASKNATPAIRACYRIDLGNPPSCDEKTTITSVVDHDTGSLPANFVRNTNVLTVNA